MDVFENHTLHTCAVPALLLVTVKGPPLITTHPQPGSPGLAQGLLWQPETPVNVWLRSCHHKIDEDMVV